MNGFPILSLLTFLPLIGAVGLLLFIKSDDDDARQVKAARFTALGVSVLTLGLSAWLLCLFEPTNTGFQFVEKFVWVPAYKIFYHMGVDGISVWFVALSALLTPIAVLSAWTVQKRVKFFMVALLVLETMMIGTFVALDFVLFYVFFEGVLIPMFLIIGVWGGEGRIYAAFKFFLYTFLGSVLMLAAIFYMAQSVGTTDMTEMMGNKFPKEVAVWLWLAFFASFAVKTPLWPFHTWLPFAHVEAPTAGSVILAGVLLKMGGYGFIRISLQMLPSASAFFAPLMLGLAIVAIVYASLVALAQTDLKKLIAYSSVAHMGFAIIGIFSFNQQGLDGAMFVMMSHGFVSAALFLGVGVVYDRLHTREIKRFGGLATVTPRYAACFMFFTLAAIGLPGTSGFVGEFLSLQGAYLQNNLVAFLASFGLVLGAAYMLWLYRRVFFGEAVSADVRALPDMYPREYAMFAPLLAAVIAFGLQPQWLGAFFAPTTQGIVKSLNSLIGGHV
jgi:NADH-quinone oxidoreductase subunit M